MAEHLLSGTVVDASTMTDAAGRGQVRRRPSSAALTADGRQRHRQSQAAGRGEVFADYRLRIATVVRDYGMAERGQAPPDSRDFHKT